MLSNIFPPSVVSLPDAAGNFNPFPTYNFSGSLRPSYPLSQRRAVPDKIRRLRLAWNPKERAGACHEYEHAALAGWELTPVQVFVGRNRIKILTKEEQDGMRKVCRLAREVLDIAARAAKPGVTTDYIDQVVHEACMEREVC
jgi:methionyl aminopeptidase